MIPLVLPCREPHRNGAVSHEAERSAPTGPARRMRDDARMMIVLAILLAFIPVGFTSAVRQVWPAAEHARPPLSRKVVRKPMSAGRRISSGCPSPATRRDRHPERRRADRDVDGVLGPGLHLN